MPTNDLLVIDIIYLVTKGCLEGSGGKGRGVNFTNFINFTKQLLKNKDDKCKHFYRHRHTISSVGLFAS